MLEGKLRRFIAETNQSEVLSSVKEMKQKFIDFEKIHVDIHNQLENETDEEASEQYFLDVQMKYTQALKQANIWLASLVKEEKEDTKDKPVKDTEGGIQQDVSQQLLAALNLPKVELDCFSGDPLQYCSFISVFEDTVDKLKEPQD